ncbi:hypothetical protein CGZ94_02190 [Enemella evansiae]|uniref:Mannosyl-glycoprotein endo-beta-N-acetylglucosamidase-like domain-containing protein n=1 Tax=Enemella evansiae TaxID=2016499 RepID=A0A255GST8_9ACTN|nr:glucosaminidase domain-containing protein [Enemella evansiae]OYO17716.1 hypothetical protein CGZ94_02190 [Enemella evansiae]
MVNTLPHTRHLRRVTALLTLALALTTVAVFGAPRARAADTTRFISAVAPMAQQAQREFRVPASVSIAQSILESGWGTSSLAVYAHAYFGIKCKTDYASPYQLGCMDKSSLEYYDPNNPTPVVSAFRTYRSAGDSFSDHGYFLKNSSRYAAAFNYSSDPDNFIREVAKAGYATDPGYADYIIRLMRTYNLYAYDSASTTNQPVRVDGAIGDKYYAIGGPSSPLGFAIGGEVDGPVAGSRMTVFNKGILPWSPSGGAHPIMTEIWSHYRYSQSLREVLGPVTSDAYTTNSTLQQNFVGGRITRTNGSWNDVYGRIFVRWTALGADRGLLGMPTSTETAGPVAGSRMNRFAGGTIIWSPQTEAQALLPGISAWYWNLSTSDRRTIGIPRSAEYQVSGGIAQDFTGGTVYWRDGRAVMVYGTIGERYAALGGPSGQLGFPTRQEFGFNGGRVTDFGNGSIYWSPATGAQPVWSGINSWYRGRPPAVQSGLGLPSAVEQDAEVPGTRVQAYAGGRIYWYDLQAHSVYGSTGQKYAEFGGARSQLGRPTVEEYDIPGGRATGFEGGRIEFSWRDYSTRVILN